MAVYRRVDSDYKKLFDEQRKATKILAQKCREKDKEIMELNKQMRHLRHIIRTKKEDGTISK